MIRRGAGATVARCAVELLHITLVQGVKRSDIANVHKEKLQIVRKMTNLLFSKKKQFSIMVFTIAEEGICRTEVWIGKGVEQ